MPQFEEDKKLSPKHLSNTDEKNPETEGKQEDRDGVEKTPSDGVIGHIPVPTGKKTSLSGQILPDISPEGPAIQRGPKETRMSISVFETHV